MILKIKKSQLNQVILIVLGISVLISLIGVTITTNNVIGANITNETVVTRAYVWNTEPNLYEVTITPGTIDLSPGNTTSVNCTGKFWDYNGWRDAINQSVNATLYDSSGGYGPTTADDNNYHYTNTSCDQCSYITGSNGTNGTCSCFFSVQYYANNGTWRCNMTIRGGPGNSTERQHLNLTDSMIANATITKLLALDVSPSELNFGNLSVTEISSDKEENITNWGNIPLNISVYGYANESRANNLSMICELGNIPASYERYSLTNGTVYTSMTQISNESTGLSGFNLPRRTNDTNYGADRNQTYWKLQIPLSVGGNCNGSLVFEASESGT